VFVNPPIVAKQRLFKHVRAKKNTHATIKLLDTVFYAVRVVSNTRYVLKGKWAISCCCCSSSSNSHTSPRIMKQ
jgi:hypothetical protein